MDNTTKGIGYAVAGLFGLYLLYTMLPYLMVFLAMFGAYALWQQFNDNKPKFYKRRQKNG